MDLVSQHPYDEYREHAAAKMDWHDQVMTNLEPTGLFVKTKRKDHCSCRLELEFQERFDRRPFLEIERHRLGRRL